MFRIFSVWCFATVFTVSVYSQSVGLVLSGGGARGVTHAGFIKALEENDIPIDYIGGTSIGAIVGSLYAMGYSPDEMLKLFLSDDFAYWQSGKIQESYYYYFRKPDPTPEFTHFDINIRDADRTKGFKLPLGLVNPIQMDQAFMGLYGQATAYSRGNFDHLFVPFLCIASDVFDKKPLILRSGDLGDAVRASMTFPLVFKPILIDSIPVYDGGIYNNFPAKPMKDAFHPDYLIGSVVTGRHRKKPAERGLYEQIESMIMQSKNSKIDESNGYTAFFDLRDVNLLDFYRGKELFDLGYERGLAVVDTIKQKVLRTIPFKELTARRQAFKRELPPLIFKNVTIESVTEPQRMYIERQFHADLEDYFSMEDFKAAYFKLLSDSKIKELAPHAIYNEKERCFDLHLQVTINEEVSIGFGGNVSSSNANQLYLGLAYQSLRNYAMDFNVDLQVGNTFSGALLSGRIELPSQVPMYIKASGAYNYLNFFESKKLFLEGEPNAFIKEQEAYFKLRFGLPFLTKTKSEISIGYGRLQDSYYQSSNVNFSTTNFDKTTSSLFLASVAIKKNTLDAKQYPIRGQEHLLMAQFISGKEIYEAADKRAWMPKAYYSQSWIQLKGKVLNYHMFGSNFYFGYLLEGALSSKNLLNNYTASIIQAPAFTPTPHSKMSFNEYLRANEYLAGGIIPTVKLSNLLYLRGDLYAFSPVRRIEKNANNKPYYGNVFADLNMITELSLVLQLPFASISLYSNHYSHPSNNWNFGLNIGFLIFTPKFIE
ncbi:MAG: patatin-like phospholipase family protein [Dysgonamonadaceae bacterium]|jgi:NTE family protein|nr:patatin-like phospholipase family protein [Dysgonamonadaceae bacterium]